jgi:hypothetical protein
LGVLTEIMRLGRVRPTGGVSRFASLLSVVYSATWSPPREPTAHSRAMHIHTDVADHPVLLITLACEEPLGRNDSYGYALAAQPDQSQGRLTNSGRLAAH